MFAVRRIIRYNLSLKNHIYTSSVLKCDNSKDIEPVENKTKQEKNNIKKENKGGKFSSSNEKKEKLTAEVNAKDYANFKSKKKQAKIELYSNTTTQEEKFEAKENLKNLTKEIENQPIISGNEKFQTLSVPQPKPKATVKKDLEQKIVKSARTVASELGGDVKKTESDILGYLKGLQLKTENRNFIQNDSRDLPEREDRQNLSLFKDQGKQFRGNERDLARDSWRQGKGRHHQVNFYDKKREGNQKYVGGNREGPTMPRYKLEDHSERIKLESEIVNVILQQRNNEMKPEFFKLSDFSKEGPKLKTWDELEELELKALSTVPPRNYFEELVQWTEEGKLWHFPIDNDQGNELEANIDFSEHVFLEEHLEPWCPKRGPLRHFMELVLTGLSKNYHFTVEEKREHILWYRDYFEGKKKSLQDMGVMDGVKVLKEPEKKSDNLQ